MQGCQQTNKKTYTITGNIVSDQFNGLPVYLTSEIKENSKVIEDSTIINNGTFIFNGSIDYPQLCTITFERNEID
ncbi:DUF4369 domain-containing protein [Zobellia nedashkovskayae]